MYKVFVNGKLIKLIDDYADYLSDEHTLFLKFKSPEALSFSVDLLVKSTALRQLVIFNEDLEELWENFKSKYNFVHAGGGLVKNSDDKTLFIYKKGKWDLPKGKVDDNEKIADTAIREVKEECGIDDLEIVRELGSTHHIFKQNNQAMLKKTTWYEMKSDFDGKFKVDKKEGIEKAEWLDKKAIKKAFENTYPSIIAVVSGEL